MLRAPARKQVTRISPTKGPLYIADFLPWSSFSNRAPTGSSFFNQSLSRSAEDHSTVALGMEVGRFDSKADDMDADDSTSRDRHGGGDESDLEEGEAKETRSKDRKKSSGRREDKDYTSKERERERDGREDKVPSRDRRKEERDDREKEKRKEYRDDRDKHRDRDRKDRGKERERGEIEKERVKERSGREKEREREKERDRGKEKERDKYREKDRGRGAEKEADWRDKERVSRKGDHRQEHDERNVDDKPENGAAGKEQNLETASAERRVSTTELQERILKAKEERTKKKVEGASELLDWVSKSRKIEEEKNAEKEKAAQLLRMFEEQEDMGQEDSEDEGGAPSAPDHLAGVKVLHGLDKVVEGGAVILTLKDQNILADGQINEEVDMLENVEIGEQKRRDDAYKAAKKKTGIYTDKFNDDPDTEKKMLPQYDEPTVDEGVTLDARGRLTAEAEKKLEELRKRLQGSPSLNRSEDLTATAKVSLDYYTQEEMVKFNKPKKKKSSMRRKEKLNLDALEAQAVAEGLGVGDLGSRNDRKRQAVIDAKERSEAEVKKNAYLSAFAKAEEASKSLRMQLDTIKEDDEGNTIVEDDEDLYKSLERARKLALKKQNEQRVSGPEAVARLAATVLSAQATDNGTSGEQQEDKIIITEMEEFVGGLQLDEEFHRPDREDVFMDEDEAPVSDDEPKDEDGELAEDKETTNNEAPAPAADKEDVAPDKTIHEAAVGKGLSGALKLLQDRGALKESVEWGGRNMDKKKSKLVGLTDAEGGREVRIERTDEFGRTLTPKEAFRLLSHKFHGKGPGKMKQEKRMKQYYEDLKLKQMKNADTPSLSAERMREAQAQLKTPYLVLSGHVKPGQNSDPRSGFATVEKDTGSLTPMLGDRKVEHFLGIKRKPEPSSLGSVKKPKRDQDQ